MTIDTFMSNYGIKKKETVIKWIVEDLIPGADLASDYVPNSARPPYTKARVKDADSIYCSIVAASRKRYHVLPKIYKICDDEFNGYINRLVEANLISIRVTDNITYYDTPLTAKKCNRKFILEAIEACSRGISEGATTAMLKQASSI